MLHARLLFPATAFCLLLSGCSGKGDSDARKKPTPQVGFVVMRPQAVPIQTILSGRVVAAETSEVRPQITGLIRKRLFTEGQTVRAGQPLFEIDPSLYRASVEQASANLASARASAEAAATKADRYRPLAEMEAVAKQDYTDALAQARQARAAVAQNGAQLETARINLRFTTVPAPIGGKIGRSLFTVGALVSANQVDPLAVIQRLDSVFVDMQQSSGELLAMRRALSSGGALPGSTAVRLRLEDGSDYGPVGRVEFSEVTVNAQTGTVTLRARFPNPGDVLLPGMFVQARFDQAMDASAYLVPQQALQRDLGGVAYLLLVGPGDKVVRRNVTADRTSGANWVITNGLKQGDKVITQGTSGLRADAPVRPVPANSPQRIAPPAKGANSGTEGSPRRQGG
ncbi:efflux RND transporter periplasmic adaptor subunit [Sphingobium sufflavum]|uniref:efflux RND transporter periplasmic adaptor subunit n=1 Tax=Sphingobium sufflavum TaxID=1129547 RepID=UPI001F403CC4|nr:efflux RND transporter periplasmic adaptor subunit [Sphingobium sufflavum]MCE7795694.1 efflux RND transporter periplasmic adaptor subunit [Sphingobium sufflavum]